MTFPIHFAYQKGSYIIQELHLRVYPYHISAVERSRINESDDRFRLAKIVPPTGVGKMEESGRDANVADSRMHNNGS